MFLMNFDCIRFWDKYREEYTLVCFYIVKFGVDFYWTYLLSIIIIIITSTNIEFVLL